MSFQIMKLGALNECNLRAEAELLAVVSATQDRTSYFSAGVRFDPRP